MKPDIEQTALMRPLADQLYAEAKALSGGIPFPGQGGGGGAVQIYSSWDTWDSAMDLRFGGPKGRSLLEYQNKIGDLSNNSLLVAAIRWLGNAIQEPPLLVKEKKGGASGKKGESEAVEEHPLPDLWNRPNDFYSGSTLLKGIAFSWVLASNAYIIKNYNNAGDEPLELWWEPHWTIRPVWPMDGTKFISYYEVNRNGSWLPVSVQNVIHLRDGLSPYNQRIGFSGVPSILPELFGDGEAAQYYATLMGGGAVPSFLISLDAGMHMSQDDMNQFSRDIISKTTGKKKGQPLVVKGAKAYKLGFNPRELDLRETRYMAEERFCAVMGIPAVVLELGSGQAHSIYNNVKQAEERAWKSYVSPFLKHMQQELTVQLLDDWEEPNNGRYCEHDMSKVEALAEDTKEKAERLTLLYEKGAIMRSEVRSGLGYGPSNEEDEEADKVFAVMAAPEKAAADAEAAKERAEEARQRFEALGQNGGGQQLPIGANRQLQPAKPAVLPKEKNGKRPGIVLVKSLLEEPKYKHEFSSVTAELPAGAAMYIQDIARSIPVEELDAQGIENHPHVTVLFGLHTQNFEDVIKVLDEEPPVSIEFGEVFIFPASPERNYDVLNFKIISPDLVRFNRKLRKALDNTVTFTYKPHACIAYLKAGEGKKYVGMANDLTGTEITLDRVIFSTRDQIKVHIPLRVEEPVTV